MTNAIGFMVELKIVGRISAAGTFDLHRCFGIN